MTAHPQQPTEHDAEGVLRFKRNAIVAFLLDAGPFDLNTLACATFSDEDRAQFAQLLGYSVDGYGSLSYVQRLADRATATPATPFDHKRAVVRVALAVEGVVKLGGSYTDNGPRDELIEALTALLETT